MAFPELAAGQGEAIAKAQKVTNPGCHATGAIALLRAADRGGLIAKDTAISINSVSGYSGGGKAMIEAYESGRAPGFELYGLGLEHKHLPEIELYSGLSARPIFVPSVGNFRQGMIVSVPLHLDALPGKPKRRRPARGARRALQRARNTSRSRAPRRPPPRCASSRSRSTARTTC